MKQQPIEQQLKNAIIETVLEMTDGYCNLEKYSFDGDDYDHLEPVVKVVSQAILKERQRIVEMVASDELIDDEEHWLTKSLETVEYGMAMDALRNYQRNLLEALETNNTKE